MGLDPSNLPPDFTRRIAVTPKKKDVQNPIQLHSPVVQEQQAPNRRKKRKKAEINNETRVSDHDVAYGRGYVANIKIGVKNDRVLDSDGVLSCALDCMKKAAWVHDDSWHYIREIHVYADPALEDFCEIELVERK